MYIDVLLYIKYVQLRSGRTMLHWRCCHCMRLKWACWIIPKRKQKYG